MMESRFVWGYVSTVGLPCAEDAPASRADGDVGARAVTARAMLTWRRSAAVWVQQAEGPSGPGDGRHLGEVPPPQQEHVVAFVGRDRLPPTAPRPVFFGEHEAVDVDVVPRLRKSVCRFCRSRLCQTFRFGSLRFWRTGISVGR